MIPATLNKVVVAVITMRAALLGNNDQHEGTSMEVTAIFPLPIAHLVHVVLKCEINQITRYLGKIVNGKCMSVFCH